MSNGSLRKNEKGFTLVELVMVLILTGILSVGAVSLFSSTSNYSNFLAKDLLVSQALLAQQTALGDAASGFSTSLTISVTSDQWLFSVSKSNGVTTETSSASVDRQGNDIRFDAADLDSAGDSQVVNWNSQAQVTSGPHSISFLNDGTVSNRVCISIEGFTYELGTADTCR